MWEEVLLPHHVITILISNLFIHKEKEDNYLGNESLQISIKIKIINDRSEGKFSVIVILFINK